MKKLLALVLALVMSMSLVTISNAAFDDAADIDYTEAVDVLNAVGVLVGSDGKFNPQGDLTRAQACKIIAYLDLGGETADAIKGSGTVFSDVPANQWYAGYVEYCAGAGYVSGVGGGKFDPDAKVTGVQFAKMLLCALGYKADVEGYNGSDWSLSIARDANKVELFDELSIVLSTTLTREQAAQMALNALKATVVEYQGGTNVTTSDGTTVTVNSIRNEVTGTVNYDGGTDDGKQQLVEKLYPRLTLTGDNDGLGRPAHTWTYKGTDVGTYADAADYTFVVTKANKDLSEAIKDILKKSGFSVPTNYKLNGVDTAKTTDLKVGDAVELFMDEDDAKEVNVAVVIRYSPDKVTGAVATKDDNGTEKVKVPGVITGYVDTDLVSGYQGLAKNDYVYKYSYTDTDTYTVIAKAGSFEGKLTEIKGSGADAKYVIGGKEYQVAENGLSISVFNTLYTYYTDANGFIIEAVEVEEASSDYVIIQDAKDKAANGIEGSDKVEARFVKLDGTTFTGVLAKIGDTAIDDDGDVTTANKVFYTYELNSDDEYELTAVDYDDESGDDVNTNYSSTDIENESAAFGSYYVDDSTVFIVAKAGSGTDSDTYKYDVYTGKNNVPTIGGAAGAVIADKNGIAKYVLVATYSSNDGSDGNKVLFVKDEYESKLEVKIDGKTVTYYTYQVVNDTELTTIKVKSGFTGTVAQGVLFVPTYDKNDMMTKIVAADSDLVKAGLDKFKFSGTTLITTTGAYTCDDEAPVFVVDADGNVSETTAADYSYDSDSTKITTKVVLTNTTDNTVKYVFVVEADK